jgi:hypothetical protein
MKRHRVAQRRRPSAAREARPSAGAGLCATPRDTRPRFTGVRGYVGLRPVTGWRSTDSCDTS